VEKEQSRPFEEFAINEVQLVNEDGVGIPEIARGHPLALARLASERLEGCF